MEINAQTAARAQLVWSVFMRTLLSTAIIYLAAQLYFGLATFVGLLWLLGIDTSTVLSGIDYVLFGTISDAGVALFFIGMGGALVCGHLTVIVSAVIFYMGKCNPFRGYSLIILTICTVGLLMPIINLFPIMWFWNWYVAWTNLKK